jgi:hypothetical protein
LLIYRQWFDIFVLLFWLLLPEDEEQEVFYPNPAFQANPVNIAYQNLPDFFLPHTNQQAKNGKNPE